MHDGHDGVVADNNIAATTDQNCCGRTQGAPRSALRGAFLCPVDGQRRTMAPLRYTARMNDSRLQQEILEQPTALQRLLDEGSRQCAGGRCRHPRLRSGLRHDCRPRQLRQCGALRPVSLRRAEPLARRAGHALALQRLRQPAAAAALAGHRHLAVRPVARYRRRAARRAPAACADHRHHQRRRLAPGAGRRPLHSAALRARAQRGRHQNLHQLAAGHRAAGRGAGAGAGTTRPAGAHPAACPGPV